MKLAGKCGTTGGAFSVAFLLLGAVAAQGVTPSTQTFTTAPSTQPSTTTPTTQPFSAGRPVVYPARGQTPEQMQRDKADAYAWAVQQSGFDPMAAGLQPTPQQSVPTTQPAAPPPRGGVVRGGAGGAAGGAAIGAIAGNAGKGAAIGAVSGGVIGGVRQRRAARTQQEAAAQQQAVQQQQLAQQQAANQQRIDAFKRAYTAALVGKGYTVQW